MKNEEIALMVKDAVSQSSRRQFDIFKTWPMIVFFVAVIFHSGSMWLNVKNINSSIEQIGEDMIQAHDKLELKIEREQDRMNDHLVWEFGQKDVSYLDE